MQKVSQIPLEVERRFSGPVRWNRAGQISGKRRTVKENRRGETKSHHREGEHRSCQSFSKQSDKKSGLAVAANYVRRPSGAENAAIIDRRYRWGSSRYFVARYSKSGQALLRLVEQIEQAEVALDELIDVLGRRARALVSPGSPWQPLVALA